MTVAAAALVAAAMDGRRTLGVEGFVSSSSQDGRPSPHQQDSFTVSELEESIFGSAGALTQPSPNKQRQSFDDLH